MPCDTQNSLATLAASLATLVWRRTSVQAFSWLSSLLALLLLEYSGLSSIKGSSFASEALCCSTALCQICLNVLQASE